MAEYHRTGVGRDQDLDREKRPAVPRNTKSDYVLVQKFDKKQNDDINVSGDDSRILRSSGEKLNNEFSDEISEEKLKADYERNNS